MAQSLPWYIRCQYSGQCSNLRTTDVPISHLHLHWCQFYFQDLWLTACRLDRRSLENAGCKPHQASDALLNKSSCFGVPGSCYRMDGFLRAFRTWECLLPTSRQKRYDLCLRGALGRNRPTFLPSRRISSLDEELSLGRNQQSWDSLAHRQVICLVWDFCAWNFGRGGAGSQEWAARWRT